MLTIATRITGGVAVLTLAGRIVLEDMESPLRAEIERLVRDGCVKLVLDLAAVSYIDSAGLGLMVAKFVEPAQPQWRSAPGASDAAQHAPDDHHQPGDRVRDLRHRRGRRAQLRGPLTCPPAGGDRHAHSPAHRPELHHSRPGRQGDRTREIRRGLPRRRHAVLQAPAQPDAALPGATPRYDAGGGDGRRQGHPHRRRHAEAGGAGRRGSRARSGAHQRAGLSGRADPGRGGGGRIDRRRSHRRHRHRLRAAAVRGRSHRQPAPRRAERAPPGQCVRRRQADDREMGGRSLRRGRRRRAADGYRRHAVGLRRRRGRLRRGGAGPRRDVPHQRHRPRTARDPVGDGLLAEWQALPPRLDAERGPDRGERGAVDRRRRLAGGDRQRVHRRRLRQQDSRRPLDGDSGAAGQEGRGTGDDARQPRGGALHRPHPPQPPRPRQGRPAQGRPHHRDRSVRGAGRRPVRRPVRPGLGARHLLAGLPAAGDALPRPLGAHQQPAAHLAALARRHAAERDPRAGAGQGGASARPRRRRAAQGERAVGQGPARPAGQRGQAQLRDQRLRARGPRPGRGALQLERAQAAQPAASRRGGARRRRLGEPVHRRLLHQLRRPAHHPPRRPAGRAVGRRQPRHALGDRRRARARRDPRRAVGQGRGRLGRHAASTCRGPAPRTAARPFTR